MLPLLRSSVLFNYDQAEQQTFKQRVKQQAGFFICLFWQKKKWDAVAAAAAAAGEL